jgi:tetratricopeptide (TPR) repeat protein
MESARRQTLWYLLRADDREARRARQRLAVGTCLALLLAGLLAAVGQAIVVVACCVLFAGAVAATGAVRALQRHGARLYSAARDFGSRFRRTLAGHGSRGRTDAERAARLLAASAACAVARLRQVQLSPPRRPIDLQRQALRLNAAGTNKRRCGAYSDAADLHGRALVMLRDIDDPHAVALTQNNLALALSHVGDDAGAISLFEQAAATLRTLGDIENEGKIMANLALAHRRHGRTDESANVLRIALTKLDRDSSAYELVEAELRSAS